MSETATFQDLIARVRAGDADATTEFVRRYEPLLRRTVHVRLRDQRLRRLTDSMDICQSVLGSFFARAKKGQYQMDTPEQLVKLLARMARNKLADEVDRQRAGCRDNRRVEDNGLSGRDFVGGEVTPSRQIGAKEALEAVWNRFTPDEKQLLELREAGYEWSEIAEQVGGSADALRKKLARAIERVTGQLGWQESNN